MTLEYHTHVTQSGCTDARRRLQGELCYLRRVETSGMIYFSKKYNIYFQTKITKQKDYMKHFQQCAKEAQNMGCWRRAALLRSQSYVSPEKYNIYKYHTFETLIDWETIKRIPVDEISLLFIIKRRDDPKKKILFIIPSNYPFIPPRIFINKMPLYRLIANVKVLFLNMMSGRALEQPRLLTRSALAMEWSPIYGIEQCVQFWEAFLHQKKSIIKSN